MQVDFASFDCQRNFLERMKSSGQIDDHGLEAYLRLIQDYAQRDERSTNRSAEKSYFLLKALCDVNFIFTKMHKIYFSDLKLSHETYNHAGNYNRFENQPQRTLSSVTALNSRHRLQRSRATQSAGGRFEHEEFERRHQ